MSVTLDNAQYNRRAQMLLDHFNNSKSEYLDSEAILFVVGTAEEEMSYQKSTAFQTWLLGYEFPDTIILVTSTKLVFLTSQKKGNILQGLVTGKESVPLEILKRTKDEDHNRILFAQLLDMLPTKIGVISKDQAAGKFATEWKTALSSKSLEEIDVSGALATLLSTKDDAEVKLMSQAARISCNVMKNCFMTEMATFFDQEKRISHDKFALLVENSLLDERKRLKLKVPAEINLDNAEWCYAPIIQSGGNYDLKPSASSDSSNLHPGTVVCSLGVRYKSYCSNVARTFFINPEKEKENNYNFLVQVFDFTVSLIKNGAKCNDIYNDTLAYIDKHRPELKEHFTKNCGFGIGIEFRESQFLLAAKNDRVLKAGQVLNVTMGFQKLSIKSNDPRGQVYALFLGDLIQVTDGEPIFLTDVSRNIANNTFDINDADDVSEEEKPNRTAILDKKTRHGDSFKEKQQNEAKRREHQKKLAAERQAEGLRRFSGETDGKSEQVEQVFRKFESYRKDTQMPKSIADLRIIVDRRTETVILPIYGQAVPFHLNTLKNVSKSDEQDFVLLRFNFLTPGVSTGKKDGNVVFEDQNATFIRALSFRSNDVNRFSEIAREINDLKKEMSKREAERIEKAGLVEQEDLVEIKGRRPQRLPDVFVRPQMDGKRYAGDLEIHTNGLRFQSHVKSDQRVDIVFSNIKHLFFQPCDGELIIVIHIHLKDAIMVGKKKTKDIQFYREVSDQNFDETGNRRAGRKSNYGDEDELHQENEERKQRAALNKEFQQFSELISTASRKMVDVDIPFRELGFHGVPFRQLVLLQPTTDCLVHLSDTPPLVVTLADVEIAHLERVQFGLKNFDLVFIFKDFARPVVHINTIPMESLEHVKEWLDSVDIPFTEGPVNLSWPQIMKTINDDPKAFFEEAGGWSFLKTDGSDRSVVSESEESEFAMESGSEGFAEESEASDSGSGYGSEEFDDSGSGSGSEEDESGEDWDELERKAARDDQRKRDRQGGYDSEEDRKKKKKR
ncbi:FACT complex subunit-domain-containing protein [Gorgonomyces haynaldii]|nr:FACT complex subunit-domain-containing protein [Gorgonomyces haynaldii]